MRKENKVVEVKEDFIPTYLEDGFDVIDSESGEVIEYATGGKTVPLAEYNKAIEEVEDLKEKNKKLETEIAKLKKSAVKTESAENK
ncbi:hypothetical protein [Bacillus sp. OTU530]|uniref:hypothetical protein n=1 Tax=Bacillus sp. OTU530 TaxID=3043862 RepID=UPI00313C1B42